MNDNFPALLDIRWIFMSLYCTSQDWIDYLLSLGSTVEWAFFPLFDILG